MNFKTIYKEAESLDIVHKSKFIGYAKPIATVEEAQAFIELIKKKHWDASHNVPVYVIGDQMQIQKYSDDGEPSGTAGVPILNVLKNEGITNVVVVITRYFGGVKLGTGGLVRAYGQSAKSVLNQAEVIEMIPYQSVSIKLNYTLHGKFQNYLSQVPSVFVDDMIYSDIVETLLYVPLTDLESFKEKIIDLTHDQCEIKQIKEMRLPISNGNWIK